MKINLHTLLLTLLASPLMQAEQKRTPGRNPFFPVPVNEQQSSMSDQGKRTGARDRLRENGTSNEVAHAVVVMNHARLTETLKLHINKMWESLTAHCTSHKHHYFMIDDASRKVLCAGPARTVSIFKTFLKEIDVKVAQVHIEARIVVANKHFEESFGMRWSGIYNRQASLHKGFNFVGIGLPENTPAQPGAIAQAMDWAFNVFPTAWEKARNLHLPIVFGGNDLNTQRLTFLLNAAEHCHEIKTILRPSILTNDREDAEILEGEVIPIESVVEESVEGRLRNIHTATYKDVGIQLRVKPNVSPDKKTVTLDLFVENSMVEEKGTATSKSAGHPSYPTIITTRSKTRIMLKSGQSTMISGLIKNRNNKEFSALPLLSRIPILGWLFKGRHTTTQDLQLLVFITPTVLG